MLKTNFLRVCILVFLIFAAFMDLGILVVIGSYEAEFFWMYLFLFGIYYTLGAVGTFREKYSLLYMFAIYVIVYRFLDITLRTLNIVNTDHTSKEPVTTSPREKRDILINKYGKCCMLDLDFPEEYIIPSCCHDDPTRGDPISKNCILAGYGNFGYRCEERSERQATPAPEDQNTSKDSKGITFFAIFYCVRTTIDVTLLFFVFLLAYSLQYNK